MKAVLLNAQQGHTAFMSLWLEAKAHLMAGRQMILSLEEMIKSRPQERMYHDMIGEYPKQNILFMGQKFDEEDWKRLLLDLFAKYKAAMGEPLKQRSRIVPALDGQGVVQLGVQSRRLTKQEASDFIEFLYADGTQRGVRFSCPEEVTA